MCHQSPTDHTDWTEYVERRSRTRLAVQTAPLLAARMLLGDAGRADAGLPTMMVRLVPPQVGGEGVICESTKVCERHMCAPCGPGKLVMQTNSVHSASIASSPVSIIAQTPLRRTVSDV